MLYSKKAELQKVASLSEEAGLGFVAVLATLAFLGSVAVVSAGFIQRSLSSQTLRNQDDAFSSVTRGVTTLLNNLASCNATAAAINFSAGQQNIAIKQTTTSNAYTAGQNFPGLRITSITGTPALETTNIYNILYTLTAERVSGGKAGITFSANFSSRVYVIDGVPKCNYPGVAGQEVSTNAYWITPLAGANSGKAMIIRADNRLWEWAVAPHWVITDPACAAGSCEKAFTNTSPNIEAKGTDWRLVAHTTLYMYGYLDANQFTDTKIQLCGHLILQVANLTTGAAVERYSLGHTCNQQRQAHVAKTFLISNRVIGHQYRITPLLKYAQAGASVSGVVYTHGVFFNIAQYLNPASQ